MPTVSFVQPDYTSQDAATYKAALDAAVKLLHRLAGFAPHAAATPDLTVVIDAGVIPGVGAAHTEVAQQTTAALVAPAANPRRDIVYIDVLTGAAGVATGAEAGTPSDPAVPAGKAAVARVNLTVGQTEIVNADIDDLRAPALLGYRVGTATGNVVALENVGGSPGLPAVDGSQLTGLDGADQVARDAALVALIKATSTGGVHGPVVQMVASSDHFSTKTGAVFDTDHYHNPPGAQLISGATGGNIGNLTDFGGLAAAFDGNTSQTRYNCAVGASATSPGTVGKDWGDGNAKTIARCTVYSSADYGFNDDGINGDDTREITVKLQGSADNAIWTDLQSHTFTETTNQQYIVDLTTPNTSTAYRYHRVEVTVPSITARIFVAEVQFYEALPLPDMTLSDDAETIDADPDTVDVYILEKAIDADPTRRVRASIDNGATWVTGTLLDSFTLDDRQLYRYACDVSLQTGTSLKIEYNTLNDGKERHFYRASALPLYP